MAATHTSQTPLQRQSIIQKNCLEYVGRVSETSNLHKAQDQKSGVFHTTLAKVDNDPVSTLTCMDKIIPLRAD